MRYNEKALLMIKEAPEDKKIPFSRKHIIYERVFAISNQIKADDRKNRERNQETEHTPCSTSSSNTTHG